MRWEHLQAVSTIWHTRRFPAAEQTHVVMKTMAELGELSDAVNTDEGKNSPDDNRGDIGKEVADVIITLMVLVGRYHPEIDVMDEVYRKLTILTDSTSGHRSALKE